VPDDKDDGLRGERVCGPKNVLDERQARSAVQDLGHF
jgi:hypothetical protein